MAVLVNHLNIVGNGVTWIATTSASTGDIVIATTKKKEPSEFCYFHDAVGQPGVISCRYLRVDCPKCGVFKIVSICAHCAADIEAYSAECRSRCKDCNQVSVSRELWKTIGDVAQ
jgi:hypothetical protein